MGLVRTVDLWLIQMVVNVSYVELCIRLFLINVKMGHISEQGAWIRELGSQGWYLGFFPFSLLLFPTSWYTCVSGRKIDSRKRAEAGWGSGGGVVEGGGAAERSHWNIFNIITKAERLLGPEAYI